jgi:hypothetical protein
MGYVIGFNHSIGCNNYDEEEKMIRTSRLTSKEKESLLRLIEKANNAQLRWIQSAVNKELCLSESAIKEGFEKRGKLYP